MSNPCAVYDFTIPAGESTSVEKIKTWLKLACKKWVFQKEKGEETDYLHYQGRISLKNKVRMKNLIDTTKMVEGFTGVHWSITHDTKTTFYVTKEETRVEGPWSDKTEPAYVPRDIAVISEWRPWQIKFEEICETYELRKINILYDPVGNHGKSTIIRKLCVEGKAFEIPFLNDFKDIQRIVCDSIGEDPKDAYKCYIIDLPRAIHKDKLYQLWGAIEKVKDGYAFDERYFMKRVYFDPPVVWVITNVLPNMDLLSRDRWRKWIFDNDMIVEETMIE